jgi:hypothetical protein
MGGMQLGFVVAATRVLVERPVSMIRWKRMVGQAERKERAMAIA